MPLSQAELVGSRRPPLVGAGATSTDLGVTSWNYQACTELPLEPMTSDGYGFYPEAQTSELAHRCEQLFGVTPRPHWMPLAFGQGADWSQASNIVFSENDKDPWHVGTRSLPAVGGVNGSVVRHLARGGAHHQDLRFSSPLDSEGVRQARTLELASLRSWFSEAT